MKQKVLFSLIAYILGIILTIISFVPFRVSYHVSGLIGYLGLIIIVFSIFYGHIEMNKFVKKGKQISSRLTPLYKFYMPVGNFLLFLINGLQLFFDVYPGDDITPFIALEIMSFIWGIMFIPLLKMQAIYLNKNLIIATDYFNIIEIKTSSLVEVSRYFIFYYSIKLKDTNGAKTIDILPKLSEAHSPFVTPKSIKRLKRLIRP